MKRFISLLALCIVVGAFFACSAAENTGTKTSTNESNASTPKNWTTTHTFTGNGGKKTESFTIAGNNWKLQWTCNPGSTGIDAPLFITPYKVDSNFPLGSGTQTTCKAGQDTKGETEEHEGGTFYLNINSGIDWTITIQELK